MNEDLPPDEKFRDIARRFDFARNGRHKKIELAAYYKAEKRGFAPGRELDDWLEAEREVDAASVPFPSY
ncbi:MAG: DUF2934 domain-containing protein [Chromatiaceae bacterium]|nr:DUF2934 domain-containing protein [Gammaproteobacteria bacterium]MCP5305539.1 DUF2934 domain-containing protein [Chromatiaceae bacterium]MCP5315498.1 DUF2934 domain-containing protein [Chromatiaceae bacterium]